MGGQETASFNLNYDSRYNLGDSKEAELSDFLKVVIDKDKACCTTYLHL